MSIRGHHFLGYVIEAADLFSGMEEILHIIWKNNLDNNLRPREQPVPEEYIAGLGSEAYRENGPAALFEAMNVLINFNRWATNPCEHLGHHYQVHKEF